mmetsp:Transcript_46228/g.118029  ORF Transcript_46228/g.118029 Transcript_46228/m.118029 type:complete len:200 (-) Transcript_46228:687-1286(-)
MVERSEIQEHLHRRLVNYAAQGPDASGHDLLRQGVHIQRQVLAPLHRKHFHTAALFPSLLPIHRAHQLPHDVCVMRDVRALNVLPDPVRGQHQRCHLLMRRCIMFLVLLGLPLVCIGLLLVAAAQPVPRDPDASQATPHLANCVAITQVHVVLGSHQRVHPRPIQGRQLHLHTLHIAVPDARNAPLPYFIAERLFQLIR